MVDNGGLWLGKYGKIIDKWRNTWIYDDIWPSFSVQGEPYLSNSRFSRHSRTLQRGTTGTPSKNPTYSVPYLTAKRQA